MSLASNANSVTFASAFDIDKIVKIYTGSFNAATQTSTRTGFLGTLRYFPISHGLTRPLACEMQWSLDGSTWYDGGVQDTSNHNSLAFSTNSSVNVVSPVSSGTVYYRVWCSWIDDYDSSNPLVDVSTYSGTDTIFDSRKNFQKIFRQDVLSFSPGTFGATETQSVTHSFGYTPNAKVWFEPISGEVWPLNAGGSSNLFLYDLSQDECDLEIRNTTIEVTYHKYSNVTRRAWYKIYYDSN